MDFGIKLKLKQSTLDKLEMIQTLFMSKPQVLLAKLVELILVLSVVAPQLVVEAVSGKIANVKSKLALLQLWSKQSLVHLST